MVKRLWYGDESGGLVILYYMDLFCLELEIRAYDITWSWQTRLHKLLPRGGWLMGKSWAESRVLGGRNLIAQCLEISLHFQVSYVPLPYQDWPLHLCSPLNPFRLLLTMDLQIPLPKHPPEALHMVSPSKQSSIIILLLHLDVSHSLFFALANFRKRSLQVLCPVYS